MTPRKQKSFFGAVREDDAETLQRLLEDTSSNINCIYKDGMSLLHVSSQLRHSVKLRYHAGDIMQFLGYSARIFKPYLEALYPRTTV